MLSLKANWELALRQPIVSDHLRCQVCGVYSIE